jgi:wyosine [tRNA(Phe)-imidazoG37] synthetase (radical SAM superfamily)
MATFLFDKIIFGPVKSRRLGISLGINLLPKNIKVCSFDCIYCECGWTPKKYNEKVELPTRFEVKEKLENKLIEMAASNELPDVITFAGNGEPTLHREFEGIIDDTIELRNRISPKARIAVLSNATMLHKPDVFNALLKVEDNIQKLDSAFSSTIEIMDCPNGSFNLNKVIDQLSAFNGKVIIQTMFIKGTFKEQVVDNTTEKEIAAWLKLLKRIKPAQVMIYTIARDTPLETLQCISSVELESIAARVKNEGIPTQVSG